MMPDGLGVMGVGVLDGDSSDQANITRLHMQDHLPSLYYWCQVLCPISWMALLVGTGTGLLAAYG
jgi:hypothetical protein